MFGTDKKLQARIRELESSVSNLEVRFDARVRAIEARLTARFEELLSRVAGSPEERLRLLLNSAAEDLRGSLAEAMDRVQRADALAQASEARTSGEGEHQPRERMWTGRTYRAPFTGYVALSYTANGGPNEIVVLRAGPNDPPGDAVCSVNTHAGILSSGVVVRRGEYWCADPQEGDGPGVTCVYTPFL